MSWPQLANMLSAWQWAVLAIVPPAVIALYFLKLKRVPLEVPSTYLWHKSIEDLHVNSIWQRLRQSLLLFLQLLLLALLAMVLLRPSWQGSKFKENRLVFLLDNSASMSATDVAPSRLDEAKRRVHELIDQMRSGDVAMIVSFSDSARVEQMFTDNRGELRRRLDLVQPTDKPTSISEALRVASVLANPGRSATDIRDTQVAEALPAQLFFFSDGNFADDLDFSLGNLDPTPPIWIGTPQANNVAIVAFSACAQRDQSRKDPGLRPSGKHGPRRRHARRRIAHRRRTGRRAAGDDSARPIERRQLRSGTFRVGCARAAACAAGRSGDGQQRVDRRAFTTPQPRARDYARQRAIANGAVHGSGPGSCRGDAEGARLSEHAAVQAVGVDGSLGPGDLRPLPAGRIAAVKHALYWPASTRRVLAAEGNRFGAADYRRKSSSPADAMARHVRRISDRGPAYGAAARQHDVD